MAKTATVTEEATPAATISADVIAAIASAAAIAGATSTKREIENPPPSWWNGFGLPDFPKMAYESVYFCGAKQEDRKLKKSEILGFNAITTPGFYGPDKTWEVKIKDKSVLDIRIQGINKRDVRMDLPRSLDAILQIIIDEQNAAAA